MSPCYIRTEMSDQIYLKYGYIRYPVSLKLSPQVEINNTKYYAKKSLHVSLVCLSAYQDDLQKKIYQFAKKFVKNNPVNISNISQNFHLVTEGRLQSIIVSVKMIGLKSLISAINRKFNIRIIYPPTHITIYTLKNQFGIALDTPDRFKQLTKSIVGKDINSLTIGRDTSLA